MVGAVVTGFAGFGSYFLADIKSSCVLPLILSGAVGGLWAYPANTAASGYRPGNIFNVSMGVSCILCSTGLMLYQRRENKRRDEGLRDYRLKKGGIEK